MPITLNASFGRAKDLYIRYASDKIDKRLCKGDNYWLFILGVNNSGTTILAKLLEMHPSVRALPEEGQLLTEALPRPDHLGVVRLWTERIDAFRWTERHSPEPALRAKKDWARLYPATTGVLLEKSPPNTLRSRWLQKNFNPSRFIAIVRNPYAVCEGIRRRNGYSIRRAANHWVTANEHLIEDMGLLDKCIYLRYEDLMSDPAGRLQVLQEFLGFPSPFTPAQYLTVSAHSAQKEVTGLRNLNAGCIARLSNCDIKEINDIAGNTMRRLKYDFL